MSYYSIEDELIKITIMFVCVCKGVTQDKIYDAIADGACSVKELREELKVTTRCGMCVKNVQKCLDSASTAKVA